MLSYLKICAFKMDLVFLIMALPSKGEHFSSKLPISSCYEECPAGYYKEGNCDNPASKYRCRECVSGTFTAMSNSRDKCLRCRGMCGPNEVEIKPCVFNSNTVCECKEGYYNAGTQEIFNCRPCQCEACTDSEKSRYDQRKCEACFKEQCLKAAECKRQCATPPDTTAALINTLTIAAGRPNLNTTSPSQSPLPAKDDGRWMVIILVAVLLWLLALCICFAFYLCYAPHWRIIKNPENPPQVCNDTHSHPGGHPTTMTVRVCEEIPMTAPGQSPKTPASIDHIGALLAHSQYKDGEQEEPSRHWPPIVLYAIINEVPLRRWKEFLRMLSVADHQLERIEMEAGFSLLEKQYQMLCLWCKRSSANLDDIFSALHDMDLSGCAQMLQERLERLQRRAQPRGEFTAC